MLRDRLVSWVIKQLQKGRRPRRSPGAYRWSSPTIRACALAPRLSMPGFTHPLRSVASCGNICRAAIRNAADALAGKSIPNASNGAPRSTTALPKSRTESSSGTGNRTASSGCTPPARYPRPWSAAPGSCTQPSCPDKPRGPPWTHRSGSTRRCPPTRSRP